jgi:DNA invertase Pin-like site-specific DNA recombinase
MRIAIYARYSSDLQNPASIEDQVALCTSLMERHFGEAKAKAVFSDAALSGSTMSRPGLTALLEAAENRDIDLIVAEGLDRISRSLPDIASIYELLQHYGVKVWTAHEGEVSDLHVGFKGTMNALYLRDMKDKVRRAHRAIAAAGRATSSVAYGYRAVRGVVDERGKYVNGLREVDPNQAVIVRRIFEEFTSGVPVRQIVRSLNDEGIPSPSGKLWRTAAISGEASRFRGILYNDLYRGLLVYNRTHRVMDPRTGRKKYVVNPIGDWVKVPVPELRIVSDGLWSKAQQIIGERRRNRSVSDKASVRRHKVPVKGAQNVRPLTGLVKCGWCGGIKNLANSTRYVCVTHRFEKKCKNSRGWREDRLASVFLAELSNFIASVDDWNAMFSGGIERELRERRELEKEAAALELRIARLLDAIEHGVKVDYNRLTELQERRDYILALPPVPKAGVSTTTIKRHLVRAVDVIGYEWGNRKYAASIRMLLHLITDKIVCTPIKDKRTGEHVEIMFKPPAQWLQFYMRVHADWPYVGKTSSGEVIKRPAPARSVLRNTYLAVPGD